MAVAVGLGVGVAVGSGVLTSVASTGVSVGGVAAGSGVGSLLHADSRVTVSKSKSPITAFMNNSLSTRPEGTPGLAFFVL